MGLSRSRYFVIMRLLLLFLVVALSISIKAQNLVKNGSFEQVNRSPEARERSWMGMFVDWDSPTKGSPDLLHPFRYTLFEHVKAPEAPNGKFEKSHWGMQLPQHGKGYAGMAVLDSTNREYLQGRLAEPLVKGTTYYIQFYLSNGAISAYTTSSFGMAAIRKPMNRSMAHPLTDLSRAFENDTGNYILSGYWTKVSGTFVAKGGEEYIILGNFRSLADSPIKQIGEHKSATESPYAYYFIDNVYIGKEPPIDLDFEQLTSTGSIQLNNILFESGEAKLAVESMDVIIGLADFLIEQPEININIIGHTDNVGDPMGNMELSKARAVAVKNALYEHGIDSKRLRTEGKGDTEPLESNDSEKGRKQNRRVEIIRIQ
ncbi:MAG: OmpA family protein [Flavobacteriales bacterium]